MTVRAVVGAIASWSTALVLVACGPSVGGADSSGSSSSETASAESTGGAAGADASESTVSAGASTSSSTITGEADETSTGSDAVVELAGMWDQGHDDTPYVSRYFTPCGESTPLDIVAGLPEVEVCDLYEDVYLRVMAERLPPLREGGRERLSIHEVIEGPCWRHTCEEGGDPCNCTTVTELCNPPWYGCTPAWQDCGYPNEKCAPWANDGGPVWNSTRCAPLDPAPAGIGEPCFVEGHAASGIDNCELESMCWDVDPQTLTGTCVAFCQDNLCTDGPSCDAPGTACAVAYDDRVTVCLPMCDPLAPDCSPQHACYETADGGFFCLPSPP